MDTPENNENRNEIYQQLRSTNIQSALNRSRHCFDFISNITLREEWVDPAGGTATAGQPAMNSQFRS